MTYWMDETETGLSPIFKETGKQPQGLFPSTTAQFDNQMRSTNANMQRQNEVFAERELLLGEIAKRLPDNAYSKATAERASAKYDEAVKTAALEEARAAAAADPEAWKDLDLSDEGIERRVAKMRAIEDQDERDLIGASEYPLLSSILGGIGASVADIRQLPLLFVPVGSGMRGGFGLIKMMGGEALASAAGEAITLPSQFDTAKEFGRDAPNIPEQLAIAAAGGAILGGAITGAAKAVPLVAKAGGKAMTAIDRGMHYYRSREFLPNIDGMDAVQTREAFSFAETAIARGQDPIKAVADYMAEIGPVTQPILPDSIRGPKRTAIEAQTASDLMPAMGEDGPMLAGEAIPAERMTPPEITNAQSEVASLTAMLDEAKAAPPRRTPLIDMLKSSGRVTAAQARKNARLNAESRAKGSPANRPEAPTSGALNVDPTGQLGQELIARGITPKTAPGLFRKGGIKNLDTQVASEMEDSFPGIMEATGTRADDTYISEGALIDLIEREYRGDLTWMRAGRDLADATGRLTEAEGRLQKLTAEWEAKLAAGDVHPSIAEYMSDHRAPRGFFVDPAQYAQFPDPDAKLAADLKAYLDEAWAGFQFTDPELDEIVGALAHRGGEAELLIEAVFSRNTDALEVRSATDTIGESAGPDRPWASDFGGPEFEATGQAGSGAEFADGTAPSRTSLTDAQRTEIAARQQQSRIRRLDGNTGDAGPLFNDQADMFAKNHAALFSDISAPETAQLFDAMVRDIETQIASGGDFDVGITLPDGRKLASAADVLAEIRDIEDFAAQIELCRTGGAE